MESTDSINELEQKIIGKIKPYCLQVDRTCNHTPYKRGHKTSGTAYFLGSSVWFGDKERHLLLSNEHVIAEHMPGVYKGTTVNGKVFELYPLYSDPISDYCFCYTDKNPDLEPISFNTTPKPFDPVLLLANNGNMGITACSGKLGDYSFIKEWYPFDSMLASTNGIGGSSGSILVDYKGQAIGLVYALATGQGLYTIPIRGIKDDLEYILRGELPPRMDNGIIPKYINIHHAVQYYNLPETLLPEFQEKFPDANNRLLQVGGILSPQETINTEGINDLKMGDIIWSVNGIRIGHNLYEYRKYMSRSIDNVILEVYRGEEKKTIKTAVFDLNTMKCKEFFEIGGVIIATANPQKSFMSGARMGDVGVYSAYGAGTTFSDLPFWNTSAQTYTGASQSVSLCLCLLSEVNGHPIQTLQDIETVIPEIVLKGKINYVFQNLGQGPFASNDPSCDKRKRTAWGDYNQVMYPFPKKTTYDPLYRVWKSKSFNGEKWIE